MSESPAHRPALSFIFVTLLLAVVGFGLLIPVLPKLVVQFRGGDLAGGSHVYGWLVSIFALMQFFMSPILGSLSDRYGRRTIILIATAGSAIDYLIMANAPSLTWLFVGRMVSGATAGVMATANAYVADVTPAENRAHAFGVMGAAFGLGFVIGPALGGLLGHFSLQLPFWFAAGCSGLNWLWGYFMLPESLPLENRRAFDWKRANPVGALLAMKRFPAVLGLAECYFILTVSQTMLQSIWVLYTEKRYSWGPLETGLSLMFVGVLMGLVQAIVVKKIVPKIGDARAVIIGLFISVVAQIGYGLASHGWMIYAIACVGALAGIAAPALQSYTTKHVPATEQGAVQGVFSGLGSLAGIVGPFIATWSFGWAIAAEHVVHLPSWLEWGERPVNWFLQHVLPHHPGIAFFEGAVLTLIVIGLAARSFRADAAATRIVSALGRETQ
jgi:MFS transporter, DHA1 family, tetracycline resistance protein